jgi:GT2 family glycosyltransferase
LGLGYPADRYGLASSEIFSPCAAAAMYLRQAFLEVEGFDEDFFSYFEDIDLGFRLQLQGYQSLYVPQAIVHHVGSATFGQRSDFAFYHSHRNLVWTFVKNMPARLFWMHVVQHGRGKVLLRAKWDAIRGLPMALKKRKVIQKKRTASNHAVAKYMKRGILQPYLLGYQLRSVLKDSQMEQS